MFADYLNITVPESHSHLVEKILLPVLVELQIVKISDGYYAPISGGGSLKIAKYLRVIQYSFSGAVLRLARESSLLDTLLFSFAEVPHNVTRLDVAHDLRVSSPVTLGRIYTRATRGEFKFSRKSVSPSHVTRILSPSLYGGLDTGTVYVGLRKHNVSLMVYDKRQELISRTGSDLGYNLTRYELRCGRKLGLSLRDVSDPSSLFWCHMSDTLKPPSDVPDWVPSPGGYSVPSRVPLLPYEALKRSLSTSAVISDWVRLAELTGGRGIQTLLSLIEREIESRAGTSRNPSVIPLNEG